MHGREGSEPLRAKGALEPPWLRSKPFYPYLFWDGQSRKQELRNIEIAENRIEHVVFKALTIYHRKTLHPGGLMQGHDLVQTLEKLQVG